MTTRKYLMGRHLVKTDAETAMANKAIGIPHREHDVVGRPTFQGGGGWRVECFAQSPTREGRRSPRAVTCDVCEIRHHPRRELRGDRRAAFGWRGDRISARALWGMNILRKTS